METGTVAAGWVQGKKKAGKVPSHSYKGAAKGKKHDSAVKSGSSNKKVPGWGEKRLGIGSGLYGGRKGGKATKN